MTIRQDADDRIFGVLDPLATPAAPLVTPPETMTGAALDALIAHRERDLVTLKRQRADRHDADFLLTVARHVGPGVVFTAGDLIAHGRLHSDLAAALGPVPARALGKRLARIARRAVVADLTIACIGREQDGCMWEIRSAS